MSDPYLQALDQASGVGARLTSAQLAQMAQAIPGARITSGERDAAHNAAVNGVPGSQHVARDGQPATALDFVAPGVTLDQVKGQFPGEQVLQHDAGSGMHFHVQGAPGTAVEAPRQPQTQPANDPFLLALDQATQGGAGDHLDGGQTRPGDAGGGLSVDGHPSDVAGISRELQPGVFRGTGAPGAGGGLSSYIPSGTDIAAGAQAGLTNVGLGAVHGARWLAEHTVGSDLGISDTDLAMAHDVGQQKAEAKANDPNSWSYAGGKLAGEVAPTLPLTEVRALEALGPTGKMAKALARYGDMSAQGGAMGYLASGGKDPAMSALTGAVAAPVLGAALDRAIPVVGAAISKTAGKGAQLAEALRSKLGAGADDAAAVASDLPPLAEGKTVRTGAEMADTMRAKYGGDKGVYVEIGGTPATTTIPAEALGSRGARTGIEAHDQMDAPTAEIYQRLTSEGVAPDEALREADIKAHGGSPTAGTVTRNPVMQEAEREGAKSTSTEGQALNLQAAQNNAALHDSAQSIVNDLGGAPAPGEAMEAAAGSLLRDSAAEKSKVSDLYKAADQEAAAATSKGDAADKYARDTHSVIADNLRAEYEARVAAVERMNAAKRARMIQGGGAPPRETIPLPEKPDIPGAPATKQVGYIDVAGFRRALDNPEMANPTIEGVKSLRSGVSGLLDAYTGDGSKITLEQAENIRQAINDAYDPMGGGINAHVGRLKASLDNALDNTEAGPAFKAARAAHKAWATQYENPKGVANLIKTDAQGNLVKSDSWRALDTMIGGKNDKGFLELTAQLKKNKDTASLNKLKAAIVQDAYQAATGRRAGNAVDQLGNSRFSGKEFHARLNDIGMAKLKALFSPQEIARLSGLGRAATHINEGVPGADNPSGTASKVINHLREIEKPASGKLSKAFTASVGAGGAALGAAVHGVEGAGFGAVAAHASKSALEAAAQKRAATQLAHGLKTLMSPEATRAADRAAAQRLADNLRRRTTAHKLSDRTAPAASVATERRK